MTRGLAVLCMVILHLFCRKGADVFGSPIIWINQDTPLVYWFGFYAEICVGIYSICMGYAQRLLYKNGKVSWKHISKRIGKLLVNYWIILALFSLIGLLCPSQDTIPGSLPEFLRSIILLHSYNGAWWFLNTYILFLLIPCAIKFYPVKKLTTSKGLFLCFCLQVAWYLIKKLGGWPTAAADQPVLRFVLKELFNLIEVLPAAWAGAFLCKENAIKKVYILCKRKFKSKRLYTAALMVVLAVLFIMMNLLHKSILTNIFSVLTFILFNIWEKGPVSRNSFMFLGKHSTNIWLTHMFFYMFPFTGLVQKAKYPVIMLAFMLALCVVTSYVEMAAEKAVYAGANRIKNLRMMHENM